MKSENQLIFHKDVNQLVVNGYNDSKGKIDRHKIRLFTKGFT